MRGLGLAVAILGLLVGASSQARADLVYTTVAGSDNDGPLSATLSFTPLNGAIQVTVTNTQTGTLAKGQAVSDFEFTVVGLITPTAFSTLSGLTFNPVSGGSWTSASGTAFSDSPQAGTPNAIDHWGFSRSGSTISVETAGSDVPGATGNPQYMILPSSGTAGSGNSLANDNFFPYIIGPGTFVFADAGVTSSTLLTTANFMNVSVSFGTGPDKILAANGSGSSGGPVPVSSPEPSTITLALSGLVTLALMASRRHRGRPE